jgi:NAD dependent epimerase/dehydratase family enzyme
LTAEQRPRALLSQSATGYYGANDARSVEEGAPAGDGFLADVVTAWEREAEAAVHPNDVVGAVLRCLDHSDV